MYKHELFENDLSFLLLIFSLYLQLLKTHIFSDKDLDMLFVFFGFKFFSLLNLAIEFLGFTGGDETFLFFLKKISNIIIFCRGY